MTLRRRYRLRLLAVASALVVVALCSTGAEAKRPSQGPPTLAEVQSFFGKKPLAVVRAATSGEAFALDKLPRVAGCGAGPLCDHPVASHVALSPDQLEQLRRLLLDPARYDGRSIRREIISGCGFDPDLALRFTDAGGQRVDALFCLSCNEVMLDPGRSATTMNGFSSDLVRQLKPLFPGQRKVQTLFNTAPHLPRFQIYELAKSRDAGAVEQALATWKQNGGEADPQYFVSGANAWFHLAKEPTVVSIDTAPSGKRNMPLTDDKSGKVAGYISEGPPKIDGPRIKRAIGFLDEGTRRFPYRLDLFVGRADLYRSAGDLAGELGALEALVKDARPRDGHFESDPGKTLAGTKEDYDVEMLTAYGREHYERESVDELKAVRAIGQLLARLFPKRPHGYNLVAADASARNDWPEARRQLEAAIKVAPDDVLVLANLGHCLEKLGDQKGAIVRYRRVVEVGGDPEVVQQAKRRLTALQDPSPR